MPNIRIQPLTREAFHPFGDVISVEGAPFLDTNAGTAERYHRLSEASCDAECGRTIMSIFRVKGPTVPSRVTMLERHPLSTQAFVPLGDGLTIYIVCEAHKEPTADTIHAFAGRGSQGVNYGVGVWHHPLISAKGGDYLVIDRAAPGEGFQQDYEEVDLSSMKLTLTLPQQPS